MPRGERQECFLLINTAKVEQIRVLSERMSRITAAWVLVMGNEHSDGILWKFADNILTVADIEIRRQRLITHISKF